MLKIERDGKEIMSEYIKINRLETEKKKNQELMFISGGRFID